MRATDIAALRAGMRLTHRKWIGLERPNALTVISECLARCFAVCYLQVTDEHFADALQPTDKAAQNPAQSAHALARQTSQADSTAHKETPVLQGRASDCEYLPIRPVPERGLEPPLPYGNMVLNHARLPIPPLGQSLRGIR